MSGVAITTSKSSQPSLILATRSSSPTKSAPAALASSALAPRANTRTRCVLPVPFGNTIAPRICWSALRTSMLSLYATSTDASNFAKLVSFARATASSTL